MADASKGFFDFQLSDLLLPAVTAGLGYLGSNVQEAENKESRDFQREMFERQAAEARNQLLTRLSMEAQMQQASAAAAQQQNLTQAYGQAQQSTLGAGQLNQGALREFLSNLQAPMGMTGRMK